MCQNTQGVYQENSHCCSVALSVLLQVDSRIPKKSITKPWKNFAPQNTLFQWLPSILPLILKDQVSSRTLVIPAEVPHGSLQRFKPNARVLP
jgi:hypothetical protein